MFFGIFWSLLSLLLISLKVLSKLCSLVRYSFRDVSSMAQILHSLSQMFSAVEDLTLEHTVHDLSSEEHNEADRSEWRKLFSSFSSVKTLRIADGLVDQVSRCLQADDGVLPLELLPELQELTYYGGDNTEDAFTSFIEARQNADHLITVVHLL